MRYGIKTVTMDDLAREMGHSKKTLYQFFENKDQLVVEVMKLHITAIQQQVDQIKGSAANAIDEWLRINYHHYKSMSNLNPAVLYDLQKYYPASWRLFNRHKHSYVRGTVRDNLLKGIKQELYRSDLNIDIISSFYIQKMEMIVDGSLIRETSYTGKDVIREITIYHLKGIISATGNEYLKQQNIFDHEIYL